MPKVCFLFKREVKSGFASVKGGEIKLIWDAKSKYILKELQFEPNQTSSAHLFC